MSDTYVVVGAGIVGLYTVFSLIDKGVPATKITLKAQYLPGDQSTYYTSPWAGANFSCISPDDHDALAFDKFTYMNIARIQRELGGASCGIDNYPATEYWDFEPSLKKIESLKSYMKDFKIISKDQLPEGVKYGISYTTWDFYSPLFLENFQKYLLLKGVTFERIELSHIAQAFASPDTKYVFNCTGIGARKLGGVEDTKVYPSRGQVVVVRAPHIKQNKMRWGKDYATYIIPRPCSGGHLILGGFLQKDNWTGDAFKYETDDIIKRTTELLPELLDEPLEIVRIAAGLRPSRHGGVRIERELIEEGKTLIHNYGASGYGYQAGFGMADRATSLLFANKAKL